MKHTIKFQLNGEDIEIGSVSATLSLLTMLRDKAGLTGTRMGCMTGDCGCCNVHLDGEVVPSCLVLAPMVEGRRVDTIEGLSESLDVLSTVQEAFHENLAAQCGFCTSGQVMSAEALLKESPTPSREEVKQWMSGNLCRCTGYYKIIDAILDASHRIETGQPPSAGNGAKQTGPTDLPSAGH